MMKETDSTYSDIASTSGSKPIDQQQHEVNVPATLRPKLQRQVQIKERWREGEARDLYLDIGVPLYKASIKCDWKAAKAILDKNPGFVRYRLTEFGDTALHISASVKRSKHAEKFVKNLVNMMGTKDLELKNVSGYTALFVAAANGNLKTVRVLVKKHPTLTKIPDRDGGDRTMLPLHVASLNGNYEVVKYLYETSNKLDDHCWNNRNRGAVFHNCVDGDMFDIALKILERYPHLNNGSVLVTLAGKPDAFSETKTSIIKIKRRISSALSFIGLKVRAPEKESSALALLRIVWDNILENINNEGIDELLRGRVVGFLIQQDNEKVSRRAIQTVKLQKLISEHVAKMKEIIARSPDSTNQNTKQASVKEEQVVELQNLISERLVTMHDETHKIIKSPPDSIEPDNRPVSSKGYLALKLKSLIFEHVADMHYKTQEVNQNNREDQAMELKRVISEQIRKIELETNKIIKEPERSGSTYIYPFQILFIAAEKANTNFLVEIICKYPDTICKLNDEGMSIFHIAVKYRHESIYNLLDEIGPLKIQITYLKDSNDNNMLHLAGKLPTKERLADVSGAALQMQRELLWFKEVRNMIPPVYRERKNKDGLTPRELFTEEHKELIRDGEKWMKETASQCMVVAALIATIVFAAAFTVPGGYNQNDGIPIFYRRSIFVVFVVADAMSLFLSSASILTFLSILTSRYAECDFEEALPKKLMLGLLTLFLSIATMVITFSISLFILYHKEMKWIPILMSVVALIPVLLYVVLQYHVLADVVRSTYGSRYLFKPDSQILYYVNTRPQDISAR